MTAYYITHRVTEGDEETMNLYSSKVNATSNSEVVTTSCTSSSDIKLPSASLIHPPVVGLLVSERDGQVSEMGR